MRGVLELPEHLAPIQDLVGASLERVERVFDEALVSELTPVGELCAHVERYRGKMLRPILVILCGLAAAESPGDAEVSEDLISLAAVCEMVHMATLVHDDVLDEAEVRRRGATLNHLRGNEAAVMLGDYLIAGAYHLCSTIGRPELDQRIARVSMDVCAGELLQLAHRQDHDLDEDTYFEIVSRKTGALIGVACELGAALAGASGETCLSLFQAGVDLGVAFQVRDDLLDLTGRESVVGKSVGKDLEMAKHTLPIIHHLRACDPIERGRSIELLERSERPENADAVLQLRDRIEGTRSIDYANEVARNRVARARATITALPASSARELLDTLAGAVIDRSH